MKKVGKIVLIVILVIVTVIVLDTVIARVLKNSPLISFKEELNGESYVDKGIIINTFYCVKEQDIITVSWHFKNDKFTCPVDLVTIDELEKINEKIVDFFLNDNGKYDNYSFNYVDEEERVVVVGLIDNSKNEQDKFRELIVDSEYIKFIQGEHAQTTDYKTYYANKIIAKFEN